jgi:hypothetical protein
VGSNLAKRFDSKAGGGGSLSASLWSSGWRLLAKVGERKKGNEMGGVRLGAHCGKGEAGRAWHTWQWRGGAPAACGLCVENVGRPREKGNGPGPGYRGIFDLFK